MTASIFKIVLTDCFLTANIQDLRDNTKLNCSIFAIPIKLRLKQIAAVLLAFYFLSGTILLPGGEINDLLALPSLYRHAQQSSPVTVTPLTFVTDHLLNIDRVLTSHQHSDHAKPDKLSDLTHHHIPGLFVLKQEPVLTKPLIINSSASLYQSPFYLRVDQSRLFRPPST